MSYEWVGFSNSFVNLAEFQKRLPRLTSICERPDIENGVWTRIIPSNSATSWKESWDTGLGDSWGVNQNENGQKKANLKGVAGVEV